MKPSGMKRNAWEVRSGGELEQVFADKDDAEFYADEARRSGATNMTVKEHARTLYARAKRRRGNPAPAKSARSSSAQRVVTTLARDAGFPKISIMAPGDVADALTKLIGSRATEFFATMYLNPRNIVMGYDLYTSGSPSGVQINPQGIFANAIGVNAAAIITAHNHPSGAVTPSADDRLLWNRLNTAGSLMGIPVLDNMVISDQSSIYYSQREEGEL